MNNIEKPKTFSEKYFLELRQNFSGTGKRANLKGPVNKWTVYFFLQVIGLGFLVAFIFEIKEGINLVLLFIFFVIVVVEIALFKQLKAEWIRTK